MEKYANKNLLQTPPFRLVLFVPLIIAFAFAFCIWLNLDLSFDMSKEGLALFWQVFKLPISIGSLSIPLAAIVASIHRSAQTVELFKETQFQNAATNYFKHKESFFALLNELESKYHIEFTQRQSLYKDIFPNNNPSNIEFVIQKTKAVEINDSLKKLFDDWNGLFNSSDLTYKGLEAPFIKFYAKCDSLFKFFPVQTSERTKAIPTNSGVEIFIPFKKDTPNYHLYVLESVYKSIFDFAHTESIELKFVNPIGGYKESLERYFKTFETSLSDFFK